MRLKRISLRDFRGISEATIELGPSVTVIAGPNEVGKSSVREAIQLIRDVKHTSRNQRVKDIQPVGQDVGPEVTVQLDTGGYELSFTKRWLRTPVAELIVTAPSPEQVAGDEAHERFHQILDATVDKDLLLALDVAQGRSLDQPRLADISSLHQALDTSADPVEGHEALLDRIDAEYSIYFTPSGRPRGDYAQIATTVADLEQQVQELEERSRHMDLLTEDHQRETDQLTQDESDIRRARDELAACQARDQGLAQLRTAVDAAHRASAEAQLHQDAAHEAQQERDGLITDLVTRSQTIATVQQQADTTAADLQHARQASERAEAAVTGATTRRDTARSAAAAAARALTAAQDRSAHAALKSRVDRARHAEQQRIEAAAQLERAHVDAPVVERLTSLHTDLHVARSKRTDAAAHVVVEPADGGDVFIDGERIDTVHDTVVTDVLDIDVPDTVRVRVHPGTPPAELQRAVTAAEDALAAALAEAEVTSIDQARRVAQQRGDARTAHDAAEHALAGALDGESLPALEENLAVLAGRIGVPDDTAPAVDIESLRAASEQAAAELEAAEADVQAVREAWERDRSSLDEVRDRHTRDTVTLEQAQQEYAREAERLDQVRATRSDAAVQEHVEQARAAATAARAAVTAAEQELAAANPEQVTMELTNATQLVESSDTRLQETKNRLARVEALLQDRAGQGIYDELTATEAAVTSAREQQHHMGRSAQAIWLLRHTMHSHRDAAQEKYVAPFTQQINRLGRMVFGSDFAVQISSDLRIAARTLLGRTVNFESLSAGAQEQLALVGRLACAHLIDPDDGAPVILDDTLGFADPDRLAALNVVLNDIGQRAQIVLLTCQPARFTSIGGASIVRLPTR